MQIFPIDSGTKISENYGKQVKTLAFPVVRNVYVFDPLCLFQLNTIPLQKEFALCYLISANTKTPDPASLGGVQTRGVQTCCILNSTIIMSLEDKCVVLKYTSKICVVSHQSTALTE